MEAAFFDLDKTIIAKSSVLAFGRPLYREGLISRSAIARSMYAQIVYMLVGADEAKMEKVRESMLRLTKGWDQHHVAEIVRETLEATIQPIIYAEALELIREHSAAGRRTVIISSSPFEVVAPLGEYLGIDDVIATRAQIDANGRYTGLLDFYAYGEAKAAAIREKAEAEGIDLSASYAYSDSITDLPMLEAVGHPVVVNPDRDLARAAVTREWEVRRFVRPVRLRDRMPVPTSAPTIAASSAAAAFGTGALLYLLWRRRFTTAR
jgi:HAD superfamily hydrolase (TIGR01490 family)